MLAQCPFLSQMQHLETLNVRNLPPIQPDEFGDHYMFAEDLIQEGLAMLISKQLLKFNKRLKVIGTGCIRYRDIWKGRFGGSTELHDFLRPHIFCVEYPINIRGSAHPLLTCVAQGTAQGAEKFSSNLRVFEPYWMS